MGDEGEGDGARSAAGAGQSGRGADGGINFSAYTLAQLLELQYTIDAQAFPQNFRNLLAEIERRGSKPEQPAVDDAAVAGRFTRRDGLRGWLQAKRTRSPLYGPGSLEVRPSQVLLRGWQRTWLGAPVQAEIALPAGSIRNATRDGVMVRLACKSPNRRVWQIEFDAADAEHAARLIAALSASHALTFDQRWADISEFYGRLRALCPHVWVTPALVLLNVAIYLAMAVTARRPGSFDPQLLLSWGANYGPLTLSGQWWRLISELFLHLNLLHLLFNMWVLWSMGALTERLFGRWVFCFVYFVAGGLASLSSIAWDPTHICVGASGAIFGILGAFLAFLIRGRADLPHTIIRVHWISTLAFVLFNLVSGALQAGIDNAAHVGGLIAGLVLGYGLARPLAQEQRRFALPQAASAAALLAAALLGLWRITGAHGQLTAPEQYYRTHDWYVSGEGNNLRLWQRLAEQSAAGTISNAELARRFQQEILPFWQSASERLQKENRTAPGSQSAIALLAEEFARDRLKWAQAIIDASANGDSDRASDVGNLAQQTELVQARLDRLWLQSTMSHRPGALANSALVVQLRQMLSLGRRPCVEAPAYRGAPAAVSPHDAPDDAPVRRQAIACQAQRLFLNGDYASLDALMKRSAQQQADLADGSSSYSAITHGLSNLFRFGSLDIGEALGRLSEWRRNVHEPFEADIVEAMVFTEWAWTARGSGYANAVTAQALELYNRRTEMAGAALTDTAAHANSSPLWYQLSLSVGLDQSIGAQKLRDIFDQGVTAFPAYLPLYTQMLRSLMPRWGGSYEAVDQLINDLDVKTHRQLGFEMYARLYWIYASLEGDDVDIFSDAQAQWPAMQSGFDNMIRHYPRSDYLLNVYANFACRAGDKVEYQALRSRLTTRQSASAWSDKFSIESCDRRFTTAAAVNASATRAQTGPSMRSFGGVTLGMNAEQLVRAKGTPVKREDAAHWIYYSSDPALDGLLDVYFDNSAGGQANTVRAVLFSGKDEAAPTELPHLLGVKREELIRRFGEPTYAPPGGGPAGGYLGFRNGIIVLIQSGNTTAYGMYTRP